MEILTKRKYSLISWILIILCGCTLLPPETSLLESGWYTYTNHKYGYTIRYPEGYELRPTGAESARDGATIRIAYKEYQALVPALDVLVEPRLPQTQFPTLGTQLDEWTFSLGDVQINDLPARQAQYRWKVNDDLVFVEIYLEGVVFRFSASAGLHDFQGTEWWNIVSSFRFLDR